MIPGTMTVAELKYELNKSDHIIYALAILESYFNEPWVNEQLRQQRLWRDECHKEMLARDEQERRDKTYLDTIKKLTESAGVTIPHDNTRNILYYSASDSAN